MKKYIAALFLMLTFCVNARVNPTVDRIEPPFWWSGMVEPELQLMVYGQGIGDYRPTISDSTVVLKSYSAFESPNYLVLYLDVENARPGKFDIKFERKGAKTITETYELKERRASTDDIQGYSSADVLYLIMPDRFANGNPDNDSVAMKERYVVDRGRHMARHGGDLKGIEDHLDYFTDLGVTAIWLNPVLENDARGGSYHGYFSSDMYNVDRRLGTNEDYLRLIDKAHGKGLKVVMDMIFNHIGPNHPWALDNPSKDWFNKSPERRGNHDLFVFHDNYSSDYDREVMDKSGFGIDVNQSNPHVAKYLIQNSIWWIENSRIDAIRQDTYPYCDYEMMRQWNIAVMKEYPQFNIVGEVWIENPLGSAWWQKGNRLNTGNDPELKSVMDFKLMSLASDVFNNNDEKGGKLNQLYQHMTFDYVYADINNVLRFLDNHDTDRFLRSEPQDLSGFKQGAVFLLTVPGTPQLYYGHELLMHGSKKAPGGDGNVRLDFPGGWEGDSVNCFTREGRSPMQNEARDYLSRLLKWRQGNKVVSEGTMKHYLPNRGVYVYERSLGDKTVMVFINGSTQAVELPMARYAESLKGRSAGHEVTSGRNVTFGESLAMEPREVMLIELQ